MGYYTKFYFRAKLDFKLPEEIRQVLRQQFNDGVNDMEWADHPDHFFFDLPRADMIPWGCQNDNFPTPIYVEYSDGSSRLEFTCAFKNYDDEIMGFLQWILPYVRLRYAKRSRGRKRWWLGYMQPETFRGQVHFFVEPVLTPAKPLAEVPGLPGYPRVVVDATWERKITDQWSGQFE